MTDRHPVAVGDVLRQLGVDDAGRRTPEARRAFADYLLANQTPAERMMARVLYHLGIEAEPQVMVRSYVVDFLDEGYRVVFEVDGAVHDTPDAHKADRIRDEALRDEGYRVVRITNEGVRNLMANVASTVGQP